MDTPTPIGPDSPGAEEVRDALERIVASPAVGGSPQLAVFLRYVVEAALRGDGHRLKAYSIGTLALGRSDAFDPQLDPIVRVEASRLRRALDRYYFGPGADDPIVIALPRGSYVPTFSRRVSASEPKDGWRNRLAGIPWRRTSVVVAGFLAGIAAIAIVLFAAQDLISQRGGTSDRPFDTKLAAPLRGNGMPVLLIPTFEVAGTPAARSFSATALHAAISDAFAQFDLVNVLREPPNDGAAGEPPGALRVDYRLVGIADYADDGTLRLQFRLVDAADGHVVWSRGFGPIPAGSERAQSDAVVEALATSLAPPFGIIYADGRARLMSGRDGDPRYRCIVDTAESFRSFDAVAHGRARACLERLVATYPNFALGFTYLAALGLREYQYGIGPRGDGGATLDQALRAARRGVELNPQSSRAYEMLFVVLFARGDLTAGFAAGDKALGLNRYDRRTAGSYAVRLISRGDIDAGVAMLRQINADGAAMPGTERFFLFLGAYLRNDLANAASQAGQLTAEGFQLGWVARAVMASAQGDAKAAQADIDRLVALNPAWRDDLAGTLDKFFHAPAIRDRLAKDLVTAGIAAPEAKQPNVNPPTLAAAPPSALPRGTGMPVVYFEPLRVAGTPDPAVLSQAALSGKLIDAFARFDTVNVVTATDGGSPPRFDYSVAGTIEFGTGHAAVALKLIDASDGTVAWSRAFDVAPQQAGGMTDDGVVVSVATSLLQSFGVIRARDRAKQLVSSEGDPRYRCILEASDSFRTYSPVEHARAKTCLEQLTGQDQGYALGFAFLALVHYREYQQGFSGPPGDPKEIELAVKLARQAAALNPSSGRAYQNLLVTLFARGDISAAFAAGDRALALNKYDMLTLGEYGGRLVMVGQIDRGLTMLRQASEFWDIRPSWHYFYLFLGHYLRGDVTQAAQDADQITYESSSLGWVARILGAAATGDSARARKAIDQLLALQPAWRDPRRELARIIPAPAIVERLAADLIAAGLGAEQ